ncbi:DUF1553 domain-containing protein [Armatimonas rosea]|uniref:Cytochrome c domain-containing protein n=1 Tax=Armatimonas rosea TaxID=685828 RepID=A0A7W9SMJ2_ARMRO|nr:DUF1553 domain-containing protein [Armatimonas rosea]MBB6048569.1 hypothetical protein [Armatimonas rosea]
MKRAILVAAITALGGASALATPANKAALGVRYGRFLSARLDTCSTCHQSAPGAKPGVTLDEFPHNPFGARLKAVAAVLKKSGQRADLGRRLEKIAGEDSDGDGVANEAELLLGHNPGDAKDKPTASELSGLAKLKPTFTAFRSEYRWQPFESVVAPAVPNLSNLSPCPLPRALASSLGKGVLKAPFPRPEGTRNERPGEGLGRGYSGRGSQNPIDAFLAVEQQKRGLAVQPPADKRTLLRRATLDITGLVPTPKEIEAFLADKSPDAYEKAVERLLASPRYGERWGRHFMDVWRYSDWAGWADGGQIRDSQPHIWRWRDWIVESLNANKGYDRMVQEMLAADELAPGDPQALRATGFLARNYKLLSREQWLEDTVNHTSKAFLGITMHCAKCHSHMYDPIPQTDYYRFRAIFEPHQVRQDRVPGELDTTKDGLPRVYDADLKAPTYLFVRGDERNPDKSKALEPGVPEALGGKLVIQPVALPAAAVTPDRREFVQRDLLNASNAALLAAFRAQAAKPSPLADAEVALAQAKHKALLAILEVETTSTKAAAELTVQAQREVAVAEARKNLLAAEAKKRPEAQKALDTAEAALKQPLNSNYTPRFTAYPAESSGRRLALARWLTDKQNPLTARVAVNHVWLRHFGQALVPSVADFGRNGRKPTHPQLLDYLADRFMASGWDLKALHKLILTSTAYQRDSRATPENLKRDPDNLYLWRKSPLRLEAEAVRDNVLFAAGHLDETRGGAEIDQNAALTSQRRSLYLRNAAEKQSELMQIFDGPSVTECYERKPSVMPQQALALANSELALREARALAFNLSHPQPLPPPGVRTSLGKRGEPESGSPFPVRNDGYPLGAGEGLGERLSNAPVFIKNAFERILSRPPTTTEAQECLRFLAAGGEASLQRRYENLVLVLFNHNDFVTVR